MDKRTDSQNKAIVTIEENLAVNAGAGTGKTKVLTERYIHILDKGRLREGTEIESIVAITFTKKATQEMKERIRKSIRDKFDEDAKWRKYYRDMEKANISTIHSFCGNLLKENPLEANIDPLFNIMDDAEASDLLRNIIGKNLEKNLDYGGDLYNILTILGQDDLDNIGDNLYNIYQRSKSNGDSMLDLRDKTLEQIDSIEIPIDIDRRIKEDFLFLMGETRSNSKFNKLKEEELWNLYLSDDLKGMERLNALNIFQTFVGANKKNEDIVDRLEENIGIALLEKDKHFLWAYEIIFKILIDVESEYIREKERESVLDYNDLEYKTYELLKNNLEIRHKYQDKYRYIMVDEFQDTNELQKNIFYYLSSRDSKLDRKNLFVVGDPKQSIYGFRGADVEVFERVMEDIEEVDGNPPINMDKNFRSIDIIIDFVNNIFSSVIERYVPLDYHHKSEIIDNIEVVEVDDLVYPDNISKANFNKMYEASIMADRIEELVSEGTYDYGDFAFLFRASTNDLIYEEALRMRGIPFYNSGGENLYERQEIKDILNSIKAISSSYDIVSTIGFMRSPMIGLNDESIYYIIKNIKDGNIYKGMRNTRLEGKEKEKLDSCIEFLEKYRYEKDIYSVNSLLKNILKDTNYIDILFLYEDGEQRVNNVYKFLDLALDYESKERDSIEGFIDYMDGIEKLGLVESQAKIKSENANVVKIMTIHKSKGLQFPVVLLPEMSRGVMRDVDNFIYNRNLGMGFKYEKNASFYESVKSANGLEDEEEMGRVLYVAMTRAEELLIIGNQGNDRGFKALLENLDEKGNINYLRRDFKYKEMGRSLKEIDRNLLDLSSDELELPNLIEFENYASKYFNSINISQFIEFRKCKRKFYYDYYKPLPDIFYNIGEKKKRNILEPVDRGNIVHKFSEEYSGEEDYIPRLKRIVESYGYDYSVGIENELDVFIKNYLKFHDREYDKIYSEEFFYIKIEDTFLSGIIDRIYIKDNKAYVYDFKTNIVGDREDLVDFYSPQLKIYAYAVEKIFDIEVVFSGIVFLEDGEIISIDIDQDSYRENINEIRDFVKFIRKNNHIDDYIKEDRCEFCMYQNLCNR